jgi:Protein of unknown function (DUF1552)
MNVRRFTPLPRRTFLRGLGSLVALPWLDAMAQKDLPSPPKRFAVLYTPNGYNQNTFVPKQTGADYILPPALEPLASVRDKVTVITGLDRKFVGGTGIHAQCGACWMSSSAPQEALDGAFPTNTTLDQVIARANGQETPLPSLELSCNDFSDSKETRYYESISWVAPGYAANTEKNPRAVFQRLFGKPPASVHSVLDAVMADARALNDRLGRTDQQKLDEYLESVRATERRIQLAEKVATQVRPPFAQPAGIPEDRGEYLRLMADLMVSAFQQDLTRVASLIVDPERWDSPRMFHGLFDKPQNHHVLTHTKGDDARASLTKIDRFHVSLFTHVIQRLADLPEGEGSVLDNTALVMGAGISDGESHSYRNLQLLLAGRAGGALAPGGRHLNFEGEVPLANLWLTLARTMGAPRERFADSTGGIKEVLAAR